MTCDRIITFNNMRFKSFVMFLDNGCVHGKNTFGYIAIKYTVNTIFHVILFSNHLVSPSLPNCKFVTLYPSHFFISYNHIYCVIYVNRCLYFSRVIKTSSIFFFPRHLYFCVWTPIFVIIVICMKK